MNKEIPRSPKQHEFLLNLAKNSPLSVDNFDFLSMQPHSKDSFTEGDEQISLHQDRFATATDYISGKSTQMQPVLTHVKKSHSKKKSADNPKDTVTYMLSTPSSTTNAKAMNKSSQYRSISRSNTAHHVNFLNSKEFAKFALSKVLPREVKKEKDLQSELSPQKKRSQTGSVEKSPPKAFIREDPSVQAKYQGVQQKKQKVKPRASNLTYNDFSSLVDQTRQAHSFMNSPQKKGSAYISIPLTKSTANLRPMTTKNASQIAKIALQQPSNEGSRRVETSDPRKQQGASSYEGSRSKERHKGTQSIASILNLRRDKKSSPEKKTHSGYPASSFHRKVASIGGGTQNSFNTSISASQVLRPPSSQTPLLYPDHKGSPQRSSSRGKRLSNSPNKRDLSAGKKINLNSLPMKGLSLDQYAGLQSTFEYLLEKYRSDMQNAQESYTMLKQVKQAYESFIGELLTQLKEKKEVPKVSNQENEFRLKCESLTKEKSMLEEELKYLRLENQRLYNLMSDNRRANRPPESEGDVLEELHKSSVNSDSLKSLVLNQQNMIEALQSKETKLMQLLFSIQNQGFDVEKLIREEALKNSDHSEHQFTPSSNKGHLHGIPKEFSSRPSVSESSGGLEICSLLTSQDMSDIIPDYQELKAMYGIADVKTSDSSPYVPNAPLKNKLKLDFKILPNNPNPKPNLANLGLNLNQQPNSEAPLGFHDEFLAKIDEFSSSWRREARNMRNI